MLLLLLLLSFALSLRAEEGEIIGGHEAKPHSRPYMAYLKIYRDAGKIFLCGGFLIREDMVLTAAHCFGSAIEVTLGAHNIEKPEKSEQKIPVSRFFPHPDYDSELKYNDIMLLKLKRNAILTKDVGLLSLPDPQVQLKPGQVCIAAGWGRIDPKGNLSDTLQEVQLTVQTDLQCKFSYPRYNPNTQLCAGDPRGIKSAFQGDSGGPLLCNNVVQGIVSYAHTDGKPPAIYTRISSFLSWIRNTLRSM